MERLEQKIDELRADVQKIALSVARLETSAAVQIPALIEKVADLEVRTAKTESVADDVHSLKETAEQLTSWYWRSVGALAAIAAGMPFLIKWLGL